MARSVSYIKLADQAVPSSIDQILTQNRIRRYVGKRYCSTVVLRDLMSLARQDDVLCIGQILVEGGDCDGLRQQKRRFRSLSLLICTLATWGCAAGQRQVSAADSATPFPSSKIYSEDARGLEQQYEPFVKAYPENDPTAMEASFAVFAVLVCLSPTRGSDGIFKRTKFHSCWGTTRPKSIITGRFSAE